MIGGEKANRAFNSLTCPLENLFLRKAYERISRLIIGVFRVTFFSVLL